jgi:protein required for attachment to host cells
MTTWILVTDAGRARLFSTELRETPWSLVQQFEHREGRQTSVEIEDTSPPGRMQQGDAQGGRRTALEPRTWPKEAEAEHYAQRLVDFLEEAVARRDYDQLVLVAPPHFLGLLKKKLGAQSVKKLHLTIDKDLNRYSAAEVRQRLIDEVFPQPAAH